MLNVEKFKNILSEKRSVLVQRLASLDSDIKRKSGALDPDWQEQAQSIQNDEVVDKLDQIERIELQKVEMALDRINRGVFGKCADCGNHISEKRLEAMPFAVICSDCAQ